MVVSHNIPALQTHLSMRRSDRGLSAAMTRLSTGFRINSAKDDAAGLAISNKLSFQIGGLTRASENATHGISLVQTAEGALNEVHNMLQRMRELAVQAANDTNTESDRAHIYREISQLTDEVHAIANRTEFNRIRILNGEGDRVTEMFMRDASNQPVPSRSMVTRLYIDGVLPGRLEYTIERVGTMAVVPINLATMSSTASMSAFMGMNLTINGLNTTVNEGDTVGDFMARVNQNLIYTGANIQTNTAGTQAFIVSNIAGREQTLNIAGSDALMSSLFGTTGNISAAGTDAVVRVTGLYDILNNPAADINSLAVATRGNQIFVRGTRGEDIRMNIQVNFNPDAVPAPGFVFGNDMSTGISFVTTNPALPFMPNTVTSSIRWSVSGTTIVPNQAGHPAVLLPPAQRQPAVTEQLDAWAQTQNRLGGTSPDFYLLAGEYYENWDQWRAERITPAINVPDPISREHPDHAAALANAPGLDALFTSFFTANPGIYPAGRSDLAGSPNAMLLHLGNLNQVVALGGAALSAQLDTWAQSHPTLSSPTFAGWLAANVGPPIPQPGGDQPNHTWPSLSQAFAQNPGIQTFLDAIPPAALYVPDDGMRDTGGPLHKTLEIREFGPLRIQTGPSHNNAIDIHIPRLNAETLGLVEYVGGQRRSLLLYTTSKGAQRAIGIMDNAISTVSSVRARLGAFQNRLESVVDSLNVAEENTQRSRSRIRDTDMARESTRFAQYNVMFQAAQAMLGQANQRPQQLLSLLQ